MAENQLSQRHGSGTTTPTRIFQHLAALAVAVTLVCSAVPARALAPDNDNFAAAHALTGIADAASADSTGAGIEAGEPEHAGDAGGHSLWWRWTAPDSGTYVIDTLQSDFDTLLAVYVGNALDALTLVASNDDASGMPVSRVVLDAVAGTTYYIAVDGFDGRAGGVELALSSGVLRVPDEFSTINEALRAAVPGETILVSPGTYSGGLYLRRPIVVASEAGSDFTVIDCGCIYDPVVTVAQGILQGFSLVHTTPRLQNFWQKETLSVEGVTRSVLVEGNDALSLRVDLSRFKEGTAWISQNRVERLGVSSSGARGAEIFLTGNEIASASCEDQELVTLGEDDRRISNLVHTDCSVDDTFLIFRGSPTRPETYNASAPGVIELSASRFAGDIGTGLVAVQVERNGGTAGEVSVDYMLRGIPGLPGDDVVQTGTITFSDGEAQEKAIFLDLSGQGTLGPASAVRASLFNAQGGAVVGKRHKATALLVDPYVALSATLDSEPTRLLAPGDHVQYTLTVQNDGSMRTDPARIRIALDSLFSLVSTGVPYPVLGGNAPSLGCETEADAGHQFVTCDVEPLEPGWHVTRTLTLEVLRVGSASIEATFDGNMASVPIEISDELVLEESDFVALAKDYLPTRDYMTYRNASGRAVIRSSRDFGLGVTEDGLSLLRDVLAEGELDDPRVSYTPGAQVTRSELISGNVVRADGTARLNGANYREFVPGVPGRNRQFQQACGHLGGFALMSCTLSFTPRPKSSGRWVSRFEEVDYTTSSTVLGRQKVSVPAGAFDVIAVQFTRVLRGQLRSTRRSLEDTHIETLWLARDIGVVRRASGACACEDMEELVAAQLTTMRPAPGSTFARPFRAILGWESPGMAMEARRLVVGTRAGRRDVFDSGRLPANASSVTIPKLPFNGVPLFVQLDLRHEGTTLRQSWVYYAPDLPAPELVSHSDHSVFTATRATFSWDDHGLPVTDRELRFGSQPGRANYGRVRARRVDSENPGILHAMDFDRLPFRGETVHVTLRSKVFGKWLERRYTMNAANIPDPRLTSHANGSTFAGTSATFTWDDHGLPVTGRELRFGSRPGHANYGRVRARSVDFENPGVLRAMDFDRLPFRGETVHVTFRTKVLGRWLERRYTMSAADLPEPVLTSHGEGSVLTGASATFTWNDHGVPVADRELRVGSRPGRRDYGIARARSINRRNPESVLALTVDNLPTDGHTVYVSHRWMVRGRWYGRLYRMQASPP